MKFSRQTKTTEELVRVLQETASSVGDTGSHDDSGQVAIMHLAGMTEPSVVLYPDGLLKVGGLQDNLQNGRVYRSASPEEREVSSAHGRVAVMIANGQHPLGLVSFDVVVAGGDYHSGGHSRQRGWLEVWHREDVGRWVVTHFEEVAGFGYGHMAALAEKVEVLQTLLHLAENGSLREVKK